jgi:hypothetical protein
MRDQWKVRERLAAFDHEQRRELARIDVHHSVGDRVCDSIRSYWRRRCRNRASTISSVAPDPGRAGAAPGADEFELVIVIPRGCNGDGRGTRARRNGSRAPSWRSVS